MKLVSALAVSLLPMAVLAQQQAPMPDGPKPRVFITDSQSWEVRGGAGGSQGSFGGSESGGARPQTAEIIKTFGQRCPQVTINNIQTKADYIVLLDHEGGKGLLRKDNKVAVFAAISGDAVISKSTLSVGGSVDEACKGIAQHWSQHSSDLLAADKARQAPAAQPVASAAPTVAPTKITVASNPDGADIEIDGSFVGSTPSTVELSPGQHLVAVKKSGFKTWERNMKVTSGDVNLKADLEKIMD